MTKRSQALSAGIPVFVLFAVACSSGGGKQSSATTQLTARSSRTAVTLPEVAANSASKAGSITGTLFEIGGPPPGIDRRIRGTITVAASSNKQWHAVTTATRAFSVVGLPAGTYRVTGGMDGQRSGCSALAPVIVKRGRNTEVEVVCNIK